MQWSSISEGPRHALRHVGRAPGFALLGILILATGIGTVTLVYSVVNAILIRPLPYPNAEQLVGIEAVNRERSLVLPSISISDFRDLRATQHSLVSAGAYRGDFATWRGPGALPTQFASAFVTEDFFRVLGVAPLIGRTFSQQEFSVAAPRTIVLSHEVWRQRFDGDPKVLGRVITIGDEPTTIIGVMPPSLREPAFVDVWLPFSIEAGENFARDSRYWVTMGRLAPGATFAQLQAEATGIAGDLARQYPETNRNWTMTVSPLHELRVGRVRTSLWVLLGATALLLVVACLNLASLLLARGLRRVGEMAVRQALGASRRSLVRQIWWENLTIAMPGGVLGIFLAKIAIGVFVSQIPPTLVPRAHEVQIDGRVLLVALAVSLCAGAIAGLMPAVQAARTDVGELMKDGNSRAGVGRGVRRAQRILLGIQLATTFVVLTGAVLLWRSLVSLNEVNPGFTTEGLYTMQIAAKSEQVDGNREMSRYFQNLVDAAASVPGVEAAAVDASAPLTPINLSFPFRLTGSADVTASEATYHFVTPGYFATLGLPVVGGRAIDPRDDQTRTPVVMVNETLARQLAVSGNVIGRHLTIVPWLSQDELEVVGVVADARQTNLSDPPPAQLYLAQNQIPWFFSTLLVRVKSGQPLPLTGLRSALRKLDPGLAVQLAPLSESIARTTAQPRILSLTFSGLAFTTVGFTLFGIYACISLSVTQRTPEFGLRMALGASPRRVMTDMSRELARVIALGLASGMLGAWLFGSFLRGQLYGVGSHDPIVFAGTALGLAVASMVAAIVPLARIAQVSPSVALRHI